LRNFESTLVSAAKPRMNRSRGDIFRYFGPIRQTAAKAVTVRVGAAPRETR
jgi:hypothetical protein